MASLTEGQRKLEENIKRKIVAAHRSGKTDSEGRTIPPRVYGQGHTNRIIWPGLPGKSELRLWPRDDAGNLIGDD